MVRVSPACAFVTTAAISARGRDVLHSDLGATGCTIIEPRTLLFEMCLETPLVCVFCGMLVTAYVAKQWRKEEKVDDILSEPNPSFDIIKEYYPHFYYKQAKNGEHVGLLDPSTRD